MRQAIRSLDKRRLLYLSSQCDAVEELIRYAEHSADKKLQPHPAYLEARRVLQAHADKLRDEDLVAHPRADGPDGSLGAAAETGSTTEDGQPRRPLPPMQMAKTW
jgi:hypothetical protein